MKLRSIEYRSSKKEYYPYSIPLFKNNFKLDLGSRLTIFVGENGTGKTSLLDGIAGMMGLETLGPPSLAYKSLQKDLRGVYKLKDREGFSFKAEDFNDYTKKIYMDRESLREDLKSLDEEYANRSEYSKMLIKSSYMGNLRAYEDFHGDGLETLSHGERFLKLLRSRFTSKGLYLLDEPESPLSPVKQLALISMILEGLKLGSQFIIASHSPILMAIPGANIISFDSLPLESIDFEDCDHVNITRDFLLDPKKFLRYL